MLNQLQIIQKYGIIVMISLYKLIKKQHKGNNNGNASPYNFSLLIIIYFDYFINIKEEIKQSKMIKTSTNKNNFGQKTSI